MGSSAGSNVRYFQGPLELEWVDGHNWLVTRDFVYVTDVRLADSVICVPAGFVTDFASIPRVLWALLPPTGEYGKAAVIHDYRYRTPGKATRSQADSVLLEAMKAAGVGRFTRATIYSGVRVGGWASYKGELSDAAV